MSTTATSLVPTPVRTSFNSSLSTTSKPLPTPMQTAPSTPPSTSVEARPSPGTFKHPRLAEIVKRQNQTLLTQSNVSSAAVNVTALVLSFAFGDVLKTILSTALRLFTLAGPTASNTAAIIIRVAQILFVINVVLSLRQTIPYISTRDTIEDIPLTPSQRALLGLPASASKPSSAANRPGAPLGPSPGYITPPRYHRRLSSNNTTSSNGGSIDRRSISANYAGTPGSGNRQSLGFSPSPTTAQTQPRPTSILYSPAGDRGSPLFHKAVERQQRRQSQTDFDLSVAGRRSSFGESSGSNGLGRSHSVSNRASVASPLTGRAAKKGVNFKWLYDQEYSLAASGGGPGPRRGLASSQSMQF